MALMTTWTGSGFCCEPVSTMTTASWRFTSTTGSSLSRGASPEFRWQRSPGVQLATERVTDACCVSFLGGKIDLD